MTDREKLEYTKIFIDKLATGINPLDDTPIPEGDLMNNVRLSRCMFYISDILRTLIEKEKRVSQRKTKIPFSMTQDMLEKYEFSDIPISISVIARKLNAIANVEQMQRISYKQITAWLMQIGMLCAQPDRENRIRKYPTEEGKNIGISCEVQYGVRGSYDAVLYNREAQQFILDHMDAIAEQQAAQKALCERTGKKWTADEEKHLTELYQNGVSLNEIALILKRSRKATRSRLHKLGYFDQPSENI